MNQSYRRIVRLTGHAMSIGLLAMATIPAGAGTCLVADVPRAFVLPDGSTHAAGRLEICLERHLTPVTELQEISVAGSQIGLFKGKALLAEESEIYRPMFYFARAENQEGPWELIGLAAPARIRGAGPKSIRFSRIPSDDQVFQATKTKTSPPAGEPKALAEPLDVRPVLIVAAAG